ncbi:MAG: hypothetical protein CL610_30450 [Anaerolineaceae bacterium]|nr:hypothetical protein [Anaerolineaceae bacterium]
MYEIQRRQAQIQDFQRKIDRARYSGDRDSVRQIAYQMANVGLIPHRLLSIANFITYLSPRYAANMLASALRRL